MEFGHVPVFFQTVTCNPGWIKLIKTIYSFEIWILLTLRTYQSTSIDDEFINAYKVLLRISTVLCMICDNKITDLCCKILYTYIELLLTLYMLCLIWLWIQDQEDLPFEKSEVIEIIEKTEEQWWKARNQRGQTGMVPVPYIRRVSKQHVSNKVIYYTVQFVHFSKCWTWLPHLSLTMKQSDQVVSLSYPQVISRILIGQEPPSTDPGKSHILPLLYHVSRQLAHSFQ